MITLVLLLLLPLWSAPVDEEEALVEEVLVVEAESACIILSLGVGDELQVLADPDTGSAST